MTHYYSDSVKHQQARDAEKAVRAWQAQGGRITDLDALKTDTPEYAAKLIAEHFKYHDHLDGWRFSRINTTRYTLRTSVSYARKFYGLDIRKNGASKYTIYRGQS